jgi:FMN phosphatase YigB (HAD superfamily)
MVKQPLHQPTATALCVISNFRRAANEAFVRLGCIADYIDG